MYPRLVVIGYTLIRYRVVAKQHFTWRQKLAIESWFGFQISMSHSLYKNSSLVFENTIFQTQVKVLLHSKANTTCVDLDGNTPLMIALLHKSQRVHTHHSIPSV